jgi:two-component system sensor kinase FixL
VTGQPAPWSRRAFVGIAPRQGGSIDATGLATFSGDRHVSAGKRRDDHHAQQLLAAVVASSDDAIISKSVDGIVTGWNPAAERIFGYSADEMIGHPIAALSAPGREGEMPAILEQVKRGERIDHMETVRRHKSGRLVNIFLTVSPIYDTAGRLIGASKLARDITAAKLVEADLSAAREQLEQQRSELLHATRLSELGQLAAALAHEVNQPLSAIANYLTGVQHLRRKAANDEKVDEGVARAVEQALRAGEIIRRLRGFARPSRGEMQPEPINQILQDAVALAGLDVRAAGIDIRLRQDPAAHLVAADRIEIQQVVFNLVRNAIDAVSGQRNKIVSLSTAMRGPEIEVAVADSGPGLAPAVKDRLFQPFVTTKTTGMGIGLSICRRIVDGHGGRLWAEDNPQGGAIFRFTLPAARAAGT